MRFAPGAQQPQKSCCSKKNKSTPLYPRGRGTPNDAPPRTVACSRFLSAHINPLPSRGGSRLCTTHHVCKSLPLLQPIQPRPSIPEGFSANARPCTFIRFLSAPTNPHPSIPRGVPRNLSTMNHEQSLLSASINPRPSTPGGVGPPLTHTINSCLLFAPTLNPLPFMQGGFH